MIIDANKAKCAIEVNICPTPLEQIDFVDVQFHVPSFVRV
jgi:hypothetical protein